MRQNGRVTSQDFLVGVNYWPQRTFVRMWKEFDAAQVRRDFALLRSLYVRLVRCFLLWEDFQPAPDRVDAEAIDKLRTVFDAAAQEALLLMPTLVVGHMSGPNWLPSWCFSEERYEGTRVFLKEGEATDRRPRAVLEDEETLAAQELLAGEVAGTFRDHTALWGWDLCNEINFVATPSTPQAGDDWVRRLTGAVHTADPDHPVTAGFIHRDTPERGFQLDAHRHTDVVSVHAYPVYDPAASGPFDVSYVARRIQETAQVVGKPAMLTEFGLPTTEGPSIKVSTPWGGGYVDRTIVNEREAAAFVRAAVPAARDSGATGALLWCFADYHPSWYGKTPFDALVHERTFGIVAADGRLKATGEALRDAAAALLQQL
jgi:endo-1,4-beta-mannosidase